MIEVIQGVMTTIFAMFVMTALMILAVLWGIGSFIRANKKPLAILIAVGFIVAWWKRRKSTR